jgi:hypothetical protein
VSSTYYSQRKNRCWLWERVLGCGEKSTRENGFSVEEQRRIADDVLTAALVNVVAAAGNSLGPRLYLGGDPAEFLHRGDGAVEVGHDAN